MASFNKAVRDKPLCGGQPAIFCSVLYLRHMNPFHYRLGVLEPLYALSKMGFGSHAAMKDAWRFLDEKKEESGKFILDWTMPKCSFKPGKKGQANKWVTLYAFLAMKHKNDSHK